MKSIALLYIPVLYLMCSCSLRQNETAMTETAERYVEPDSIYTLIGNGNSAYIGFVERFYFNNKDCYIKLYFKNDDINQEEIDQLVLKGDSVIYQDEDNTRIRVPFWLAKKNFVLSGLEPLYIYNHSHKLVATTHIKRIEFLDQNISPEFIAVFEAGNLKKEEQYYCLGNRLIDDTPVKYQLFEDSVITEKIVKYINIDDTRPFECRHFKGAADNFITVLNSDTSTYIVEGNTDNLQVLYFSGQAENIGKIIFIPVFLNDKPLILAECFIPESDIFWNMALAFNGRRYTVLNKQRL